MGVHSLEKLGAKMGANSFNYQRVRAERNSENLGALNSLVTSLSHLAIFFGNDIFQMSVR